MTNGAPQQSPDDPKQAEEQKQPSKSNTLEQHNIDNPWKLLWILLERHPLPGWVVLLLLVLFASLGIGGLRDIIVTLLTNPPKIGNLAALNDSASSVMPSTPTQTLQSLFKDPKNPSLVFQAKEDEIEELNSDGSVSAISMMREMQIKFTAFPIVYGLNNRTPSGSEAGKTKLKAGIIQMALLSEPLTKEDEREGLRSMPIGKDAIAIVVHKDNPIDSLTIAQLRKIYTCEETDWRTFGWTDNSADQAPLGIDVFNRSNDSGTRTIFKDKILGQNKEFCQETQSKQEDDSSFTTWEKDETTVVLNKIGKYGIYFASLNHVINDDSVKTLAIEGVYPNEINVLSDTYSLTRDLYVAAKAETYPEVIEFIDFVISPEGQRILSKYHIPIYKYWGSISSVMSRGAMPPDA